MDIQATKLELIELLLSVEKESILKKVEEALTDIADDNKIVAYTTKGEPLTPKAYKVKIGKGLREIEEGRYTTDEDLAREIENW